MSKRPPSTRHQAVGIKQAIRYEWMQKTTNLLLAGLSADEIRAELHTYLEDRMGSGRRGDRSPTARSFAVSILMSTWITPDPVLTKLRDAALVLARGQGSSEIAAHWAMISAAYPFWHNIARQVGRLLALQDQITMKQVIARTVEHYGDRQTVTRNAQFVVRSFAYWQVLGEADSAGFYTRAPKQPVPADAAALLLEAALHAIPTGQETLSVLVNSPAFFPFQLPVVNGDMLAGERVSVNRYGLDAELVGLVG